jgi:hypothetical protein
MTTLRFGFDTTPSSRKLLVLILLLIFACDLATDLPADLTSDLPADLSIDVTSDLASDLATDLMADLATNLCADLATDLAANLVSELADLASDHHDEISTLLNCISKFLFLLFSTYSV